MRLWLETQNNDFFSVPGLKIPRSSFPECLGFSFFLLSTLVRKISGPFDDLPLLSFKNAGGKTGSENLHRGARLECRVSVLNPRLKKNPVISICWKI